MNGEHLNKNTFSAIQVNKLKFNAAKLDWLPFLLSKL